MQVAYFSFPVDIYYIYIHHVIGGNFNGPRGMFIGLTSGIQLYSANFVGKIRYNLRSYYTVNCYTIKIKFSIKSFLTVIIKLLR